MCTVIVIIHSRFNWVDVDRCDHAIKNTQFVVLMHASLDKNLNFLHAGNHQDRARFPTLFLHSYEMLPYVALCEEMSHFGKQNMYEISFLVQCMKHKFFAFWLSLLHHILCIDVQLQCTVQWALQSSLKNITVHNHDNKHCVHKMHHDNHYNDLVSVCMQSRIPWVLFLV